MNSQIVLIAQQFCADHFCDNNLDMDNYMFLVDRYLEQFDEPQEKVEFLVEVKRIGKLFVADALRQVEVAESFDISKVDTVTF